MTKTQNLSYEALENFIDAFAKFIVQENMLDGKQKDASDEDKKEHENDDDSSCRSLREVQQ